MNDPKPLKGLQAIVIEIIYFILQIIKHFQAPLGVWGH